MEIFKLAYREVSWIISTKTRRFLRKNYPNLWKRILEEFDEFKNYSSFALLGKEIIHCGEYALLPCLVGLICHCFGFVPFAFTWLSVIFMVHCMTKDLHQQEYNESVVSPKLWIRCLADLLIALLGFYFHEAPIIPNNDRDISNHVKVWGCLIFSCFTSACEDFGFYRLYLAIMKGIAVTYRIINPDVCTSFVTGGNAGGKDLLSEKQEKADSEDYDKKMQ